MKTFIAIGISIILGQYYWLSDTWPAYGLSLNLQLLIAWALVFYLTPYVKLAEKTAAFIFALSSVWDIFVYMFDFYYAIAINVAIFASWLLWAALRPYSKPSVEPQQDTIYLISKRPDSFWTFIPSLLPYYSPGTSGYSILCNGARYGFRHGAFEIIDFDAQDYNFVTATSIKYKPELINYLATKQGAKWTLFDNCVTVHFKLKWMDWHV